MQPVVNAVIVELATVGVVGLITGDAFHVPILKHPCDITILSFPRSDDDCHYRVPTMT